MKLKWRRTNYGSWQLFWDGKVMRCAEVQPVKTNAWSVTLSYNVAPMDLAYVSKHNTLEEAQEYTENLVRVLIIGGHHVYERN